ncbi:MAG: RidA family protein [Reyranella sp.]|uniref:RidA family protein n=1 Tax=Reyranella sp. TaxID=1929291 RepID=UPI001AC52535|nr:RidA family protein [Reyranella sp.]MBN9086807.1 RidA family protein [Reyranella sp.]
MKASLLLGAAALLLSAPAVAQTSPNGVKAISPPGAPKPVGAWGLGSRAGDLVFMAGMQGFGPDGKLPPDPETRIRQAFLNIKALAASEGASLHDCVRVTVYLSDLHRYAGIVDKVQAELWGNPPYPPRTMVEVQRLFDDDIIEVDTVFYAPVKK